MNKREFGSLKDGRKSYLYTLENRNGVIAKICDYGAALVSLIVPDSHGNMENVILGLNDVSEYELELEAYLGSIVGRCANRIAKGKFRLDDMEYTLECNDGANHLHGGKNGFNRHLWSVEDASDQVNDSIKLTIISQENDGGYPGTIKLSVTYTLTDQNELLIEYSGTSNAKTILNPTNHAYFNLTGDPANEIINHQLKLNADFYTPIFSDSITTGEILTVNNTPFDFTDLKTIGKEINSDHQQIQFGNGYDHNWVINSYNGKTRLAAEVYEPISGRVLEVLTDQPGIQFYSANFLDGSIVGKGNIPYNKRCAFCLEAQYFPDSPNKKHFPSPVLNAGQKYKQNTIYRFSVR